LATIIRDDDNVHRKQLERGPNIALHHVGYNLKKSHVRCGCRGFGGVNMSRLAKLVFAFTALAFGATAFAQARATSPAGPAGETAAGAVDENSRSAYLFVYFKDTNHSLHFALSRDGYTFADVNAGKPIMDGKDLAEQKGIRDPHIMRGPDGAFCMVMTDLHVYAQREGLRTTQWERPAELYDWGNNRAIVMMKSPDLIHWSHSDFRIDKAFEETKDVGCIWAPETIFDPEKEKLMVYFTMRLGHGKTGL
jgi:hypothetical protein